MENIEVYESQSEEILLAGGVKAKRKFSQGNGNWLERSLNDSDCLLGSLGPDCQLNASTTQSFPDVVASSAASSSLSNNNNTMTTLPPHLRFDERSINDIAAYSVLFVIAAIGNLTVFITLFRNRHRKSRVNLMIMHLAAADLMVTLINFPIEVGWRITVQWLAGNLACKLLNFLRAFGLYLSSLVLVCISLDRYFAIVHPLKVNDAQRRGKMMLSFAWSIAAVCSIPQSVIFYEASHPQYKDFKQCVTFYFFETPVEERTYNVFCLVVMYFLPLLIIIVVYLRILWEISQKSKDSKPESSCGRGGRVCLRRSDMTNIEKARARTLKMTVIIVLAFIICWTPYVVMVLWYMFDKQGAEQVQSSFQDALFIMAVSNSCVNPIVYGTYTINLRKELNRCFGRKTTPPVLARKSTGSTAMRTTVTAQLSHSNTLKMSTHTQVLPRDGSGGCSTRRNPSGGINGKSPHTQTPPSLQPPPPPATISSASSLQTSFINSSPEVTSRGVEMTPLPQPPPAQQSSKGSGCVMLEIEVDMDGTIPNIPGPSSPAPVQEEVQPTHDTTSDFFSNRTYSCDSLSHPRFSFFSLNSKRHLHDNVKENVMLTAFTPIKGSPITQPKFASVGSQKKNEPTAVFHRKLSADSGVFFESQQRRKQNNHWITGQMNPKEVRHMPTQKTPI